MTIADRQHQDDGASAVEYGLIVSLIALVIVAAVTAFGGAVAGLYNITF
jgi:Flp pilus assembly pilin Flp